MVRRCNRANCAEECNYMDFVASLCNAADLGSVREKLLYSTL